MTPTLWLLANRILPSRFEEPKAKWASSNSTSGPWLTDLGKRIPSNRPIQVDGCFFLFLLLLPAPEGHPILSFYIFTRPADQINLDLSSVGTNWQPAA